MAVVATDTAGVSSDPLPVVSPSEWPSDSPTNPLSLLQGVARRVAWVVMIGPLKKGGEVELLRSVLASGVPVLLIDPQLSEESLWLEKLSAEERASFAIRSDLLGGQPGEQLWYSYNDPRWNGTVPLEALRRNMPNLSLVSLELRTLQALSDVLASWALDHSTILETDGLLWSSAERAPLVLEGDSDVLQHFEAVWLDGVIEAGSGLASVLRVQSFLPGDSPEGHQLWLRDVRQLLRQQLEALQHECSALEAERDASLAECDQLKAELSQQYAAMQLTRAEHNALLVEQEQKLEALSTERETLLDYRKELETERDALQDRVTMLEGKLSAINHELDEVLGLIDSTMENE